MDVSWIQDFLTLCELRNFTRAAESRHVSQAAFSRRIKYLEGWLGVTLIDRSVFPTKLTAEGENFRDHAIQFMAQMSDARAAITGFVAPKRDQVRIALPHALAIGRLATWSTSWSAACSMRYTVITGNVHDTVTALVSGNVDILICFHNPQQPIHLSSDQYERTVVGTELLRPYASKDLLRRLEAPWPGTSRYPVPLLMYSPGAYLARMVDYVIQNASVRLNGSLFAENEMADVLRQMAACNLGIAWLPDCAVRSGTDELVPVGDTKWTLPLSIIAYRDKSNRRSATQRLWTQIVKEHAKRKQR